VTESPRFNREAFWQHSIGCGAIAKTISEQIGMDASRAFVAGIVHDIGKVILDAYFPDYFEKALQEAASEHLTIYEAERRVLPMTHEDVGRHLAQQWLLPEELVAAIGSHHSLEHRKQAHTRLSELIHVANTQCRLLKVGHSGDDALSLPNSHALQHLGLRPADLQAWQPQMHEAITAALAVIQG
jgi:putative nucleotidyltransferase with HDIG domain